MDVFYSLKLFKGIRRQADSRASGGRRAADAPPRLIGGEQEKSP